MLSDWPSCSHKRPRQEMAEHVRTKHQVQRKRAVRPSALPKRLKRRCRKHDERRCPAHRAWVRSHACCVPGCQRTPIECAHVRRGSDGGIAQKPSDWWCISLCWFHHSEQHQLGETSFERKHNLDLLGLSMEFARRSPHRLKLRYLNGASEGTNPNTLPRHAGRLRDE